MQVKLFIYLPNYQNIMNKGVVKFFNFKKGFGFIVGENGEEVFVHVSGLIDEVKEDDKVAFDITDTKKGPTAINVKRI